MRKGKEEKEEKEKKEELEVTSSDTPYTEVVEAFMTAWLKSDFNEMLKHTQKSWIAAQYTTRRAKDNLRMLLTPEVAMIKQFCVLSALRITEVVYDVTVEVTYQNQQNETVENRNLIARVICEKAPIQPSKEGTWGVNPVSLFTRRYR